MGNPVELRFGEMSDADLVLLREILVGSGGFFGQFASPIDRERRRRAEDGDQPRQSVTVDFSAVAHLDERVLAQFLGECQACRDRAVDAGPAVSWFFDQLVIACMTELEDRQSARRWQNGPAEPQPSDLAS